VGLRFNPPPGWPPVPEGFTPQPGWQPDPSWPPPPPGWQLWVNEEQLPADPAQAITAGQPTSPPLPANTWGGQYGSAGAPYGNPNTPYANPNTQYANPNPPYGSPGAPYGTPYGVAGQPPGTGPASGWAIASFVLGSLSVVVLSVIFAFIALSRIKRLGQRGRGLAIAGLALSAFWIVVVVVAIVAANAGKATRSAATGVITHRGHINAFSLRVGDCFDNPAGAQTVNTVTAIPCDQPHNAQIYAKFKLTGSDFSYPGAAAVAERARNGCNARTGSVNKPMTTSAMTVRILLPDETSWVAGQRTVGCMVVNPIATVTTSLLNSAPAAG
jgi:Domain of unknown function (DUF4190)/Septum formation